MRGIVIDPGEAPQVAKLPGTEQELGKRGKAEGGAAAMVGTERGRQAAALAGRDGRRKTWQKNAQPEGHS